MHRTVAISLISLILATEGHAQQQTDSWEGTVYAHSTEVTFWDQLNVARQLVFTPAGKIHGWPDYLYELQAIKDSSLCNEPTKFVEGLDLGTVAAVKSSGKDNYKGLVVPLATTDFVASATHAAPRDLAVASLSVRDLCGLLALDDAHGKLLDEYEYLATSRVIPARDVSFSGRVRITLAQPSPNASE